MSSVISLYPKGWRERYGQELREIVDGGSLDARARVDLLRGLLDAHLHPARPSPVPVVAALTASALAVAHAITVAIQPVPTDWPGYLDDALPLIAGSVLAMVPALVGIWLKLGDADGALGRIGIVLSIVGHLAWLVSLVASMTRIEYGALTAAAATIAMVGTGLLGLALVGHARILLGFSLVFAALAGVFPPSVGWGAFAVAWTVAAAVLVLEFASVRPTADDTASLSGVRVA